MNIIESINNLLITKVYAQSLGDSLATITSEDGPSDAEGLVDSIVGIAVPLASMSVVVLVVYAGYILMSSQGNPDKLKEGKEVLTNAIIGFLVILLSVAILLLLSNTLGLDIYN
jgi:hypothetical protein